jgi:cephalosporin hydroxylase
MSSSGRLTSRLRAASFDRWRVRHSRAHAQMQTGTWAGKPLSSLTHEDLLVYQHFLADPQPQALWVAGAVGNIHEATRAGALSTSRSPPPASVRQW